MPTTFSRSMRLLEADSFRRSHWGMVLLCVWAGVAASWFLFAKVELHETTDQARLEVESAAHPIETPVAGRVVASHLKLGQTVAAGELLVELESEAEQLRLKEERVRFQTFVRRREALREQIAAEQKMWPEEQQVARLAIDEARARQREAEAAAQFSESEAQRLKQLDKDKLVSKSELLRLESEAQRQRAAATAQGLTVSKLEAESHAKAQGYEVRLAMLQRDLALLEGDMSTAEATIKRWEYEVQLKRIQAPVAGRVGEISELRVGGFVTEGKKLAAIVPPGELRAVGHFSPLTALGRIHSGQPARLRLDGFPWTQYGCVAARVVSVANEVRDGRLRVELAIDPKSAPRIPLQHGLSGLAEVEVERVTPASLVLRAAGRYLSTPGSVGVKVNLDHGHPPQ